MAKIKLILNPGAIDPGAFAICRRIMDQDTSGALGDWAREHPKRKPYSQEVGKMWVLFRRGGVTKQLKLEWAPPVSVVKMKGTGQTIASFQSSTGWKIEESALQQIPPLASAKELLEDFEEMS